MQAHGMTLRRTRCASKLWLFHGAALAANRGACARTLPTQTGPVTCLALLCFAAAASATQGHLAGCRHYTCAHGLLSATGANVRRSLFFCTNWRWLCHGKDTAPGLRWASRSSLELELPRQPCRFRIETTEPSARTPCEMPFVLFAAFCLHRPRAFCTCPHRGVRAACSERRVLDAELALARGCAVGSSGTLTE